MKNPLVVLNVDRREVTVEGVPVYLAPKEFSIIEFLANAKGKVVSRKTLLKEIWGYDAEQIGICNGIDTRTVDQHVARCRIKLRFHKADTAIVTIPSCGYRGDGIEVVSSKDVIGTVRTIKRQFGKNPGSLLTMFVPDLLPTIEKGSSLTLA